ncbi:MAG: hypothetical protein QM496_21755 [Verrucomicrobiota bacterium]
MKFAMRPFRKKLKYVNLDDLTGTSVCIAIATPKFDAMVEFFEQIAVEVKDSKHDQFCPLFSNQRGATLRFPELIVNLEENTELESAPYLSLLIAGGYPEKKLRGIAEKIGQYKAEDGLYGRYYTFTTPDGGTVRIESSG